MYISYARASVGWLGLRLGGLGKSVWMGVLSSSITRQRRCAGKRRGRGERGDFQASFSFSLQVKEQKKRMDGPVDREGRKDMGGGGFQKKKKKCEVSTFLSLSFFGGEWKRGLSRVQMRGWVRWESWNSSYYLPFFSKLDKRTQLLTRYICHFDNVASAVRNVRKWSY